MKETLPNGFPTVDWVLDCIYQISLLLDELRDEEGYLDVSAIPPEIQEIANDLTLTFKRLNNFMGDYHSNKL